MSYVLPVQAIGISDVTGTALLAVTGPVLGAGTPSPKRATGAYDSMR